MKKPLMMLLMLLLVACGSAEPPAVAPETPDGPGVPTTVAVATTAPNPVEIVEAEAEVTAVFPATTPEEAAVVRPQDWVLGAAEPTVTIIEYGDFQ